ncbi:MAG TPA: hypothetical protein DHV36_15780 [Desulfobacteraceae bacterium]|nr:hypothetical protein [Desulfobacteraceae bacterium]
MTDEIIENFGMDTVSENAAGFASSLMALADYVDGSVEKVIRKACIDLYRAIVERTPVDTGRAKANWMISTSDRDLTIDHDDGFSFAEINALIDEEAMGFSFELHDDVVIITNNLEYISELENGTSKQAPRGMVSVSLAEFTAHFNAALAGLEGLEPT